MRAIPFDAEAGPEADRAVIRRMGDEIEMVELRWGFEPEQPSDKPWRFIRSEGRSFPSHRCLIPVSEFQIRRGSKRFRAFLDDGNWFYLAGLWRPATRHWPESFAVITIPANAEVSRYQERQGAVIRRNRHMAWIDGTLAEAEMLQPLPPNSFAIEPFASSAGVQHALPL